MKNSGKLMVSFLTFGKIMVPQLVAMDAIALARSP